MEFDNNKPVSDEQRRLAESKKLTLQPIHADVQPEDKSDSEIVTGHLTAPAIANVPNDTEQDTAPIQPSRGLTDKHLRKSSYKKYRTAKAVATVMLISAVFSIITATIIVAQR